MTTGIATGPSAARQQHTGAAATDTRERTVRALRRRQRFERAHLIAARFVLGALALQIFFAGLGVFGVASFLPHAIFGATLILSSFSVPIIAWTGHLERAIVRRSWLLAGLMIVQGLLIDIGRTVHIVAALHPVNAMLLVLVTYSLARRR
ncbi:MAG TPA: DUF6220 domain-containing protein [Ktedonobacterales bacterium]